jgi:hypothetical protein
MGCGGEPDPWRIVRNVEDAENDTGKHRCCAFPVRVIRLLDDRRALQAAERALHERLLLLVVLRVVADRR